MERQTADGTLEGIHKLGLVAVVRGESCRAAIEVSDALIEGGALGIEIAFTTPEAHRAMRELSGRHGERILLGAGTVTTEKQAEQAVQSGASFLVSPGLDPALVAAMRQTGLAVLPGVLTPSEVMSARRLGLEVLKLFPGTAVGPDYLKALKGPFPDVSFVPTGGVTAENARDWFNAGAFAVGVGGALAPKALGKGQERERVVERTRRLVEAVREAMDVRERRRKKTGSS